MLTPALFVMDTCLFYGKSMHVGGWSIVQTDILYPIAVFLYYNYNIVVITGLNIVTMCVMLNDAILCPVVVFPVESTIILLLASLSLPRLLMCL